VADPREVVKAGDVVKVKVMEVDVARKRIALSMRLDDEVGSHQANKSAGQNPTGSAKAQRPSRPSRQDKPSAPGNSAMADAFAKLKR
jgi:uncharacterized protein